MKRIVLVIIILLIGLSVPAWAEETSPNTPYTWDALATVGGATAATLLIVQYLKVPLDKWRHIPTRALVLMIAFLILIAAHAFTKGVAWADLPLILLNAFIVSLSAMGAYETTFARLET